VKQQGSAVCLPPGQTQVCFTRRGGGAAKRTDSPKLAPSENAEHLGVPNEGRLCTRGGGPSVSHSCR